MNHTRKLLVLTVATFLICQKSYSDSSYLPEDSSYAKNLGITVAVAVTAYVGYKLYNGAMHYFKQKKEEYITNQIVEHICIALTPVTTIHALKEPERTQALRKKAWLIQLRKRLVQKIETVIASGTLSHQHTQALSDMLSQTKTVFGFVDLFRRNNEFEAEYEKPTLTDSFIESEMVRSIMLSTKPNEECTQEELLEKERAVTRRNLIVQKVTSRGIKNYLLTPLMLLSMI